MREERVLTYASNHLTPAQKRYCVTRRELLAVIRFTRQFCHYLLGRKFLKQTDHGSLTWLFRFKCPEGQLAHWLEELSRYDFHIEQAVNTQMQMPCQGEPKNSPMNVTVTKLE